MKVYELKTKRAIEVNDSYGSRLIEQGRAVLAPADKAAHTAPQAAPQKVKKGD